MKVVIIHGQSHKGSTYHIAHMLAVKISEDIKEFFLPRDFGEFCVGCTKCFTESEKKCPHFEKLKPITDAMDEANVIIISYDWSYESFFRPLRIQMDGAQSRRIYV